MEESTTYQAIISKGFSLGKIEGRVEGRVETAREILLDLGTGSFGDPSPAVSTFINSVSDYSHLKRLAEQIIVVKDWDELLKTP